MKDLTQGSILSHISTMAPQIFAGMIMIGAYLNGSFTLICGSTSESGAFDVGCTPPSQLSFVTFSLPSTTFPFTYALPK